MGDNIKINLKEIGWMVIDFSVKNFAPMLASPPVNGERLYPTYEQNTKADKNF
jgi:hypothetical protein